MPIVELQANKNTGTLQIVHGLAGALAEIVSKRLALSEETAFPPSEVTVEIKYFTSEQEALHSDGGGLYSMSDDIQILIDCQDYPIRGPLRDEIADLIAGDVHGHLRPGMTCWVWLGLKKAGFARRGKRREQ